MPSGLTNAPAIFQHMMNDIFGEYLDDFVKQYIDDILIFFKNDKDHEKHVHLVLIKLHERVYMPSWRNVCSINLRSNFLVILVR